MTKADFESVFQEILGNRYYTNHGPLAKAFESLLESHLDVSNVVTVGNDSLAMLIALASLEIEGDLILPALDSRMIANIANGLGLTTTICDVDPSTFQLSIDTITPVISENTAAVIVVETGGRRSDPSLIGFLVEQDIKVIVVAFDSFPNLVDLNLANDYEQVVTLVSFGPGQILTTLEGGAIITQNDDWAHRFRNMRSSYGVRESRTVKATCNGRFSEFQAGVGIKDFAYLKPTIDHNHQLANSYDLAFSEIEYAMPIARRSSESFNGQFYAISFPDPGPQSQSNASVRDQLSNSGIESAIPACLQGTAPNAQRLCGELLWLPINNRMTPDDATEIARLVKSF